MSNGELTVKVVVGRTWHQYWLQAAAAVLCYCCCTLSDGFQSDETVYDTSTWTVSEFTRWRYVLLYV